LANSLINEGEAVNLFTGEVLMTGKPLDERVHVHYLKKYNRNFILYRIYTWFLFSLQVARKLKKTEFTDCVVFSNPPILIFLLNRSSFFNKTRFHYVIFDIYPDVLLESKLGFVYKLVAGWWVKQNKIFMSNATSIFTISNKMKSKIEKYVKGVNIHMVYPWANTEFIQPIDKEKSQFRKNLSLKYNFNVLYSGNIGYTHGLETIISLAEKLQNQEVGFIIIGEGSGKPKLQMLSKKKQLDNILFLPWQPAEILCESLNLGDIAIISQGKGIDNVSLPSKTFNYLAAGRAILAIGGKESELESILRKFNCGVGFDHNDIDEMASFVVELKNNHHLLMEYQKHSRYAAGFFTPKNASKMAELILSHPNN